MKVGDYVRTKKGIIGKIKLIDNQTELEDLYLVKRKWYYKEDFIKCSPNIIDLIENGDIVKYEIDDEEYISEVWGEKNDYFVQNFDVPIDLRDLNIVSIVTKEQFESIEYKVKE